MTATYPLLRPAILTFILLGWPLTLPQRLMMNAAADVTNTPKLPVETDPSQDNPSVWVVRRVADCGDVSCENGVTAEETRPATRLAKDAENPLKTGVFQGVSAKGSGRSRTDDDGFAIRCLSHLATEPTDEESAIDSRGLSFPGGRIGKTGAVISSGRDCSTGGIVVAAVQSVNRR